MASRVSPSDGTYDVTLNGHGTEMEVEGNGSVIRWPKGSGREHRYERTSDGWYVYVDEDWDPPLTHTLYTMDNGDIISVLSWEPYGSTSKNGTYEAK